MNTHPKRLMRTICICIGLTGAVAAAAETVTPLNGQSAEQMQADIAACQAQVAQQTAPAQTTAAPPVGGRARGAAAGAAAGAIGAEVRANDDYERYDDLDSDVKEAYRREEAEDAARAGAAIGASRQRRERREVRQQNADAQAQSTQAQQQAYSACITAKGYSAAP